MLRKGSTNRLAGASSRPAASAKYRCETAYEHPVKSISIGFTVPPGLASNGLPAVFLLVDAEEGVQSGAPLPVGANAPTPIVYGTSPEAGEE